MPQRKAENLHGVIMISLKPNRREENEKDNSNNNCCTYAFN